MRFRRADGFLCKRAGECDVGELWVAKDMEQGGEDVQTGPQTG